MAWRAEAGFVPTAEDLLRERGWTPDRAIAKRCAGLLKRSGGGVQFQYRDIRVDHAAMCRVASHLERGEVLVVTRPAVELAHAGAVYAPQYDLMILPREAELGSIEFLAALYHESIHVLQDSARATLTFDEAETMAYVGQIALLIHELGRERFADTFGDGGVFAVFIDHVLAVIDRHGLHEGRFASLGVHDLAPAAAAFPREGMIGGAKPSDRLGLDGLPCARCGAVSPSRRSGR